MDISQQINQLLEKYDCTAKELAGASGMSVSVISRYRNGTRHPSQEQLRRLADGFAEIAKRQGGDIDPENLFSFSEERHIDTSMLVRKFNILVSTLDINMNDFARFCSYDPSLISRVRSKKRVITNPQGFAENTGRFLYQKYRGDYYGRTISSLIGIPQMPAGNTEYVQTVKNWLCSGQLYTREMIFPFTDNLKTVDVEAYLKNKGYIFPEKVEVPFRNESRTYVGVQELKQAELDFLRFALNSHSKRLYLFSNLPYNAIVGDDAYSDEWLYLMSRIVNKGVNIHIVNHTERVLDELLLAMKRLLPLYISGKLHAYYIPGMKTNLYCHHCSCIDDRVIYAECVSGFPEKTRCVITRDKTEVAFRQSQMQLLLKKARPLMNVYQRENESVYHHFLNADSNNPGERIGLFSGLHIGMLTDALIRQMAEHNHLTQEELKQLLTIHRDYNRNILSILRNGNRVHEQFYVVPDEEFDKDPPKLMIVDSFFEKTLYYNFDEYKEHQRLIMSFMQQYRNYTAEFKNVDMMKNINFLINRGHWASLSRAGVPNQFFVIRQPRVREALENVAVFLTTSD